MEIVKIPHAFRKNPFKKWMQFLLLMGEVPRNKNLGIEYFLKEFSVDIKNFVAFLDQLEIYFESSAESAEKVRIAEKYLKVIAPLCERFNLYNERNRLDDLGFSVILPKEHKKVGDRLLEHKLDSENLIPRILENLEVIVEKEGFAGKVLGRYKNIYSVYRKLEKKAYKSVLDLNDIYAFRIILEGNNASDCFDVINKLHDHYIPLPYLFKDYISIPKINGYQSLHTGLSDIVPGRSVPVEIQVRTKCMHDSAEHGIAAHWTYSQEKKSKLLTEKEKKLMDYYDQATYDSHPWIYCFSLNGGIIKMKRGLSAIDFASKIHTKLAQKATGAKVNGKNVSLDEKLSDGDFVEILK